MMTRLDFPMAEVTLIGFCLLISLSLISTSEAQRVNAEKNRKRVVTDPVSNFFSELGDLFLDIDRSLAVQTAPKVEYEDELVAQIFRPSNEYSSDAQKNYRKLQRRLGAKVREDLGPKNIYSDREHFTVSSPKLKEDKETSTPIQATDNLHKNVNPFQETEEGQKDSLESVRSDNRLNRDCSHEILDDPFLDSYTREKCSRRLKHHVDPRMKSLGRQKSKSKSDFLNTFDPNELDSFQRDFQRRSGDVAKSDSKPEGRIIGDVLYSESLFDRHVRQLLRDHGKWILDNPFLTRWRTSSGASSKEDRGVTPPNEETEVTTAGSSSDSASDVEPTQVYVPASTESETEFQETARSSRDRLPLTAANYYKIVDNNGIIEEEVDIVLQPQSDLKNADTLRTLDVRRKEKEYKEKIEAKETVILAFTSDGVPLKLRMGPEIENPIRFLHKVLKSAGVSLNVPVESYDDIEPVGKEVMKFGTGVLTRAIYLDLSNTGQLKSLLRTLMTSKASGGRVKF